MTNTVMLKARSEVEEKIHDAMEAAMAAGEGQDGSDDERAFLSQCSGLHLLI